MKRGKGDAVGGGGVTLTPELRARLRQQPLLTREECLQILSDDIRREPSDFWVGGNHIAALKAYFELNGWVLEPAAPTVEVNLEIGRSKLLEQLERLVSAEEADALPAGQPAVVRSALGPAVGKVA